MDSSHFLYIFIIGTLKGGVYSLVALGVIIVYKSSKVVSFLQGGLVGVIATLGWLLVVVAGLPLWSAILICLAGSLLLGLALDCFTLRPIIGQPLLSSIMVTVALFWFFNSFTLLLLAGLPKPFPTFLGGGMYNVAGWAISQSAVWTFLIVIVLYGSFILFYRRNRLGLAMRGIAEDPEVVQGFGIKVKWILSQTWMISALTAGVAALLLASITGVHMGLIQIGWKGLVVAIVGGLESIPGALIMGPVIGILEVLAVHYLDPVVGGGMEEIAPFIVLVFILVIRPYGLLGLERIERV